MKSKPSNPTPRERAGGVKRRDFVTAIGLGTLGTLVPFERVIAGPSESERLVPEDKKLDPAWVRSLFERGTPSVYHGEELKFIGMPIGGIGAGQLYLGGDGRLWHWDIFNEFIFTGSAHYAKPLLAKSPVKQSFALRFADGGVRPLDSTGFPSVSFRGEYPIGKVEYRDKACPITVKLEAFSPFIPLNTDDSSLPATILHFTLHNHSQEPVEATLVGSLENAVLLHHREFDGTRVGRRVDGTGYTFLDFSVEKANDSSSPARPDFLFEDWNRETYEGWAVEGNSFGNGPVLKSKILTYQGDVGGDTVRVVNSHASAPGKNTVERDNALGKLTSRRFTIERNFICLWVGGGDYKAATCVNLVINGKVVCSVTGPKNNKMISQSFDVRKYQAKEAVLEILDSQQGAWGNIGVGRIWFSDIRETPDPFDSLHDNGTMGLALLGTPAEHASENASVALSEQLVGELGRTVKLAAGESTEVTFVVAWHFPNLKLAPLQGVVGRWYASRFPSAASVADYVANNFERLARETRLWWDTWYDSTLPFWFLDRTLLNASILATSTCYRFANGRFYAWEGVGNCAGTCTHVWHYAHSAARLFPDLERILRERVDFGLAFKSDGAIRFRGEANNAPATDGQAGSVLRAYREHQMMRDDSFLKHNWPHIKKALQYLIHEDGDEDGLLSGAQHNTLDADWFGPVAWLSGLYLAALRAGEAMAEEMEDDAFARQCHTILASGTQKIVNTLFDGEYFINRPDPQHPEAINSGTGCEIDQVMGQSWAFQVGLDRVFPQKETIAALRSLWRYNFTPDVGPFREKYKPGRWYAMAGEAGLLMCTFPRSDWDFVKASGQGSKMFAGYFNECMNGFEHQVAGHMIWEGMVQEGLAIERAVHDRYHASRRNPWNEIECGDHYARSMASHGVFLAACGYEYHGPKGHLGFAPRLTPDESRIPFTSAAGWGTFQQQARERQLDAQVELKYGQLRLRTIALAWPHEAAPQRVVVSQSGHAIDARFEVNGKRIEIALANDLVLQAAEVLKIAVQAS